MSRMTIECACERGGDCTRISACSADSMLQDQAEEYDNRIEGLERKYNIESACSRELERDYLHQISELKAENTRLQDELNAANCHIRIALDQPPTARATDPETSHEAAKNARFGQTMRQLNVLLSLRKAGPMTDFELALFTGTQQNSIGKRRLECLRAGLVEPHTLDLMDGVKVKRPSRAGGKSMAQVWRLTAAGTVFIKEWMERNDG